MIHYTRGDSQGLKHMDSLKVIEIFASIQGESSLQGLPTVFVRLSGCNLRCSYCDTVHAYSGGEDISLESILERVAGFGIRRVCVTGGEPLLQTATPELVRYLVLSGSQVSVETNGTFDASALPPETIRVIDVKCPGSGEGGTIHPHNLELVRATDEFKFVLSGREDFEFARTFARKHRLPDRASVLLSPVWESLEPCTLADWIVREMPDARLNLQLHKYLWPGESRGR